MFIELLLTEAPRKGLKVREPELFRLVEKNFGEISEALERGYSWRQIFGAFTKYYKAEWRQYWGVQLIREYYERIRKEQENEVRENGLDR